METTFIYALNDPETGECRYVGKADDPRTRLPDHIKECRYKTHHRANWIKSLIARGLSPILEVIDEVPFEHWPQLEVAYIEFFREQGFDLVNGTPGGENPPSQKGKKLSAEHRAKIVRSGAQNSNFGKKLPAETCAKISAALTGKKHSSERVAKNAGTKNLWFGTSGPMGGKNHSEDAKAKIGAAHRGVPKSKIQREKTSAALLGHLTSSATKQKIRNTLTGRKDSEETRKRKSDAQKIRQQKLRQKGN